IEQEGNPVVTLHTISMVQQLYTTIYALPPMPKGVACTLERGLHYTLTFYNKQQMLITVVAENDGCRQISIAGEPHARTAMDNKTFWNQLDTAIYEATPVAHVDSVAVMPISSPFQQLQTAQITSTGTAQKLYNAILALPAVAKNNGYLGKTGDYQLNFHASDQSISSLIDLKQKRISLQGQYHSRSGIYQMNQQFIELFTNTLAGVQMMPARPDSLSQRITTSTISQQFTVKDTQLRQHLYSLALSLPTTQQSPPTSCLSSDKAAGKEKWYDLTFSQWNLTLLGISAYEASCTFVARGSDASQSSQYLQADQQFWTLLHQAANQ